MTSLTRRNLLRSGAASATLAAAGCVTVASPPARKSLGLAPITVSKELAKDYAGTLRKVGAMGYTHFGFALAQMDPRIPPGPPARDIASMVRDAGMQVGVVRYGLARPGEEQFAEAAAIGASIVAYTAAPVFFQGGKLGTTTRAAFDAWLPELGKLAQQARAAGLRLAFHNHFWDHHPLDGETPLEIIARTYSPADVAFEIDLAWAKLGGRDPLALVEKYGSRVVSMHFKDVAAARGPDMFSQLVAPGEGDLDYATLVPKLDALTDGVGYVEVDNPADGLAAAETGARTILAARGES
ncbi:MAG: sugar phosphate isomerase/epimerase [Novosphingobium sp.]|nr:sugar phosphate isomerase/epimerase [Novosphingobium sp.]